MFGREEALRLNEEIMRFQWFEGVTWDNNKDLRGTTFAQPPPRFRFALQQAQHATHRATMHLGPSSRTSEPAWKVLVLSSWLLLGRPATTASDSICAHFLAFSGLKTGQPWAMVRADRDDAPLLLPPSLPPFRGAPTDLLLTSESPLSARLPPLHDQVNVGSPQPQAEMLRQSQSPSLDPAVAAQTPRVAHLPVPDC